MNDDYQGAERRTGFPPVTREEFQSLKGSVERIETALFAKDDDNEFEGPGLMTVARRMNDHIDAVCSITKWCRNAAVAILGIAMPTVMIGKALNWW